MIKMKRNLDYVILYANELKKNNSLFKQQKMLIESQLRANREIFRKRFGKGNVFKINAREYLRKLDMY